RDAGPLRLGGEEPGELEDRPGGDPAGGCAGFGRRGASGPTAGACRAPLLGCLKVRAPGVDLAALCPLPSPSAQEPCAFVDDVPDGGPRPPRSPPLMP